MKKDTPTRWSDIHECGTYLGLQTLLWLYNLAGIRALHTVLYGIVGFYYLTNGPARRSSLHYLKQLHRFMGEKSPWKRMPGPWLSFQHFMTFARTVTDKIIVWLGHYKLDDLSFYGYDAYQQARDAGKGVVLISTHLGNAELCGAIASSIKKMPLTVLTHSANAPNFKRIMSKVTGRQDNIEIIEVTSITPAIAMQLQERTAAGGTIIIAGDRTAIKSQSRYDVIPFLGRNAAFAQGPFILSSLLDCPVFLLFSMKQGSGYHIYFEPFAKSLKMDRKDREQTIKKNMQSYVGRLEHYACSYPLQWFNFYNYWALPDESMNIK